MDEQATSRQQVREQEPGRAGKRLSGSPPGFTLHNSHNVLVGKAQGASGSASSLTGGRLGALEQKGLAQALTALVPDRSNELISVRHFSYHMNITIKALE